MTISRRGVLKIIGSGAVIIAAGAGGFALTREPTDALAPWRAAASIDGDIRVRSLAHAILAPNPHNRQPWLVDLDTPGQATLFCELDRRLPETDPFDRQITIGLGCFLELLRMTAAEGGYRADIDPFPQGLPGARLDLKPIATITFVEDEAVERDPLFAQVFNRRTNREPYDTGRALNNDDLAKFNVAGNSDAQVIVGNDENLLSRMRVLTSDAFQLEIDTPRTFQESVDLMRVGKAEIEANPDGIAIQGAMIEGLYAMGLVTKDQLGDPDDANNKAVIAEMRKAIETAMGYLWITTPDDSRISQLEAGRLYVRAGLNAAELGLAVQPLSQALQEYPEMDEHYSGLHKLLSMDFPNRVQMLARLGYAEQVGPSPRWPAKSRIKM